MRDGGDPCCRPGAYPLFCQWILLYSSCNRWWRVAQASVGTRVDGWMGGRPLWASSSPIRVVQFIRYEDAHKGPPVHPTPSASLRGITVLLKEFRYEDAHKGPPVHPTPPASLRGITVLRKQFMMWATLPQHSHRMHNQPMFHYL